MANTTISLETFDVLELLYLLAEQRRTGALQIIRDDAQFTVARRRPRPRPTLRGTEWNWGTEAPVT